MGTMCCGAAQAEDMILGGRGTDHLYGNDGPDILYAGGPGDEFEDGGAGADTCFSAAAVNCEDLQERTHTG